MIFWILLGQKWRGNPPGGKSGELRAARKAGGGSRKKLLPMVNGIMSLRSFGFRIGISRFMYIDLHMPESAGISRNRFEFGISALGFRFIVTKWYAGMI